MSRRSRPSQEATLLKCKFNYLTQENRQNNMRLSSTRETRLFPEWWSLRRSTTLRVLISPLSEH